MSICPVCNSLYEAEQTCASCGHTLVDAGTLQDFFDDSSAYLDRDIYEDDRCNQNSYCVHLFACPHCHADKTMAFKRLDEKSVFGDEISAHRS
jgi:rubredoxin